MRIKVFIVFIALSAISCNQDEETQPLIQIDASRLEATFNYEDYYYTALMDTVTLDLGLSYPEETGDTEFIVRWSINNKIVKTESGSLKPSYQLSLSELDQDHLTLHVEITNSEADFSVKEEVILNNSPFINFRYPAVGQRSEFGWHLGVENCDSISTPNENYYWQINSIRENSIVIKEINSLETKNIVIPHYDDKIVLYSYHVNQDSTSFAFLFPENINYNFTPRSELNTAPDTCLYHVPSGFYHDIKFHNSTLQQAEVVNAQNDFQQFSVLFDHKYEFLGTTIRDETPFGYSSAWFIRSDIK